MDINDRHRITRGIWEGIFNNMRGIVKKEVSNRIREYISEGNLDTIEKEVVEEIWGQVSGSINRCINI